MRIIFCGDRNWTDLGAILDILVILKGEFEDLVVIEGEAAGADVISRKACEMTDVQFVAVPANWDKYQRAAGPIRNTEMLITHKADGVVAFHNDIANSKGTRNMVYQTQVAKKPVWTSEMGLAELDAFITKLKEQKQNPLGKLDANKTSDKTSKV